MHVRIVAGRATGTNVMLQLTWLKDVDVNLRRTQNVLIILWAMLVIWMQNVHGMEKNVSNVAVVKLTHYGKDVKIAYLYQPNSKPY